jgi:diaminopimelate epimerase
MIRMSGSGNTFCVVDNRAGKIADLNADGRGLCGQFGMDGVLYAEASAKADIRMRIVNADGSEAEMCGNGARCFAKAVFDAGLVKKADMTLETGAGLVTAVVGPDGIVRVGLTDPKDIRLAVRIDIPDFQGEVHCVNTGVPHAVVLVEDVGTADVFRIGRALRRAETFAPAGTNVNFLQITGPDTVKVRTYERGVENETQACGTGSTASAIVAFLLGKCRPPVAVTTRSGEILTVAFKRIDGQLSGVTLEGKVGYIGQDRPGSEGRI